MLSQGVSCLCLLFLLLGVQQPTALAARIPALSSITAGQLPAVQGAAAERVSDANAAGSAGIEFVARQPLFDYATQQGLTILTSRVQQIAIPDVSKSFNVPLIGDFTLQLSNLKIVQFRASSDDAKIAILTERFALIVKQVHVQLAFDWHWEKLGISSTGNGELELAGGDIDYLFRLTTATEGGHPVLEVLAANSHFSTVDLTIHSFSADWLYQAVLSLFNDKIQQAVSHGIALALHNDVPDAVNKVLETLPTKLQVRGLPFSTSFEYNIFALTYVMIKGYGQIAAGTSVEAANQMVACPFTAKALPRTSDQLGQDDHMISLFFHESMANCMLWGLFNSGALRYDLVDGTIPKLHLTTDLLAMLIPGLPKAYPHQLISIAVEARSAPQVAFNATTGATIQASYRTSLSVANETLGNPKIATLVANLTIVGQFKWDSTLITSVTAQHSVEQAAMPVPTLAWDRTIAWFIQSYAGLYPLSFLVDHFVHTPVTSLVALQAAQTETLDGWFSVSSDVLLTQPLAPGQELPSA
ncbi:hypothetical protein QJQ45_019471 [Haematococcus lacustris]|nr:hypothetical protein QJQ45_019471 [Haematococcus lacustris]